MAQPYILGIGAANVDLMGRSREPLVMEDSNPGSISVSVGGVTHNICENAAKMGVSVRLMTAVGDDLYSDIIRGHCHKNGIDTSAFYVARGHGSSSYLSIHQPDGDMAVALSDMSVLQLLPISFLESHREALDGAAAIVMDAGLPQEVLDYVSRQWGGSVPLFVDPVSTTYARKLRENPGGIHTVKPNLLEAQVMAGMEIHSPEDLDRAAGRILDKGVRRLFVSMGKRGVYYADREGRRVTAAVRPLDRVVNATGAGDAFMAGLLYSFLQDSALGETLDFSMAASVLAISHQATINPDMSADLVRRTVRQMKETELK